MAGPRRKKGSGSGAQREDEHEDVPDQPRHTGDERPLLSCTSKDTKRVWWEATEIVDLIGQSVIRNYNDYYPNWRDTPSPVRDKMFNWFKDGVRTDMSEKALRKGWESKVKRRISGMVYRVSQSDKKPAWVPEFAFQRIKKRKDDPKFVAASQKAKANRMTGAIDGKALGTSTLGRTSAARVLDSLALDSDNEGATPYKLMTKSKKNKQGKWISKKAEEIDVAYTAQASLVDTGLVDPFQLYYNVAGGFNEKGRVYGTGEMARELWTPPSHRTRGDEAAPSVQPGLFTRYATENANLKKKVSQLESTQEMMLKKLQEEHGWTFPDPTCTPGPISHRRDDFHEDHGDGHGFTDAPPVF